MNLWSKKHDCIFYLKKEYHDKKNLMWEEVVQCLKEKWPDEEKFAKKYQELRAKEVKLLIFDKYLKKD